MFISLILEACQLKPVQASVIPPTSTPSPPVASATAPFLNLSLAAQAAGLLPAAQGDLKSLANLTRYAIQVQIDPQQPSFQGSEHVVYTNTLSVPLDAIFFRLLPNGGKSYGNGSLSVSRAAVNAQPVQTALSVQDSALEISLPTRLPPGGSLAIDLDFSGQVPVDYGGNPGAYGIYNQTESVLALSGWYPILAVYGPEGWRLDPVSAIGDSVFSEMAFYSVEITLPKDQVLASTGVVAQQSKAGDQVTYQIVSGPARDFFLAASPDFKVIHQEADGAQINAYYLPGCQPGAQVALDTAVKSVNIYNDKLGPYPYQELDIVQAPLNNALGVEYPEIFLIGSQLYQEDANRDSFTVTVAHEVAHQWWYNLVGNDVFIDPWLDEALASYTSSLYLEFTYGEAAAGGLIDYWQQRFNKAFSTDQDELVTQSVPYFESLDNPGVYGAIVYAKGALFFKALRQEIGDQAFFSALEQYYTGWKYRIARPTDLLELFENASGRDLGDFYDRWLYDQ